MTASVAESVPVRPPFPGDHQRVSLAGVSEPLRVVIGEDDVLMREGIARVLAEAGLDVVAQTDDADYFLRRALAHRPDVAVVDVRMPPDHEAVEALSTHGCGHGRGAVLLLDGGDVERDVRTDELAVAPAPDLVRPAELAAPVVDNPVGRKAGEERGGVVCVGRVDGRGNGLGKVGHVMSPVASGTRTASGARSPQGGSHPRRRAGADRRRRAL